MFFEFDVSRDFYITIQTTNSEVIFSRFCILSYYNNTLHTGLLAPLMVTTRRNEKECNTIIIQLCGVPFYNRWAYGDGVLFSFQTYNMNEKKINTVPPKTDDRLALDRLNKSCLSFTRFLSFIRVIPVLVVRHDRRPPSPPPTLTPQKLFNFEIVFDFFSASFLLLPNAFLSLSLSLAAVCMGKRDERKTKKKIRQSFNEQTTRLC